MTVTDVFVQIFNLLDQKKSVLLSQFIECSQIEIFFLIGSRSLVFNFELLSFIQYGIVCYAFIQNIKHI